MSHTEEQRLNKNYKKFMLEYYSKKIPLEIDSSIGRSE